MANTKLPPEKSAANAKSRRVANAAGKISSTTAGSSSPQARNDAMNMMSNIVRAAGQAEVTGVASRSGSRATKWQKAIHAVVGAQADCERALRDRDAAESALFDGRLLLDKERPNGTQFEAGDTVESAQARNKTVMIDIDRRHAALRDQLPLDELERALTKATDRHHAAVHEMLATRAPDLPAAIGKLEVAIEYGCEVADLLPLVRDLKGLVGSGQNRLN